MPQKVFFVCIRKSNHFLVQLKSTLPKVIVYMLYLLNTKRSAPLGFINVVVSHKQTAIFILNI